MSREEREEDRRLREELKKRRELHGDDEWKIRNGRVVKVGDREENRETRQSESMGEKYSRELKKRRCRGGGVGGGQ